MAVHGITINEIASGTKAAVRTTAGLPVYVGTAPINLGSEAAVNTPVLCYSQAEFVASFGSWTTGANWSDWTLLEAGKAHFSTYAVGPAVFINVIDPDDAGHIGSGTDETHILDADGEAQVTVYGDAAPTFGVLSSTVVVKKSAVTKTLGTDYTLTFDSDGYLTIAAVAGGTLAAGDTITVTFDYLDPSGVVEADIIGSVVGSTYKGLDVAQQVFPRLKLVPGILCAPKWSQDATVAARMVSIARALPGGFKCLALCDLSTATADIANYTAAAAWKTANNFDAEGMIAAWPKVKNDADTYHASTVIACVIGATDKANDGEPRESPSNKEITATAIVDDDGAEIYLTREQANSLNAQGIVTFLNGQRGFVVWGNRLACYPGTTDTKDAFIPVRRVFDWTGNTIVLTTDNQVDEPGNRRLIDAVTSTINTWINGRIRTGTFVDGRIEFREDDNPVADLADGIYRWHLTLTPPSPAESIEFTLEYSADGLAALFA